MNVNKKKWYKNSWTYITGALLLSFLQIITFMVAGEPLKITSAFAYWGAWIFQALGGDVSHWSFFATENAQAILQGGFLKDPVSIRNMGIIIGALLSTLLASQFKFRKIKSKKHLFFAALGGLLMGYGAKIASGCNIGAFWGGIVSLSLSGWVFGLFLFIGAIIGSKLLVRYLM